MKKNLGKSIFSKIVIVLVCMLSFSINILNPVAIKNSPAMVCGYGQTSALPSLKNFFKTLFNKNQDVQPKKNPTYVYLGGYPLGFTMDCAGVVVVAISNDSASNLKEGDVITHIEKIAVNSSDEIFDIINREVFAGRVLDVDFRRGNEKMSTKIKPIYDDVLQKYKLGLWIRDNSAGVGTLTYIRKDNLRFGALGHPVCDIDTGTTLPILKGKIFKCNIVGYKTGVKGNPGELKGLFLRSGSVLGNLDKNNKFGVYGTFTEKSLENYSKDVVEVAGRESVKNGKAKIRCTIDGTEPGEYEIEIVKTYFQKSKDNKSMFIRVTDKELLAKTGGIVQGMSGSPIIQNGKLVGAVTHVFVTDPTKGYGVYADWMIDN